MVMAEIKIRLLGEDEFQVYREVRLAALREAPEAFVARYEDEAACSDDFWRDRMNRAHRIVAERDGQPVGLVCLGVHEDDPGTGEIFGLWADPAVRGEHAAWALVTAASQKASEDGYRLLYFWAGSDNPTAVGFASAFGFRPTAQRRPVRVAEGAVEEEADEVAMVLPLTEDRTLTRNPYLP